MPRALTLLFALALAACSGTSPAPAPDSGASGCGGLTCEANAYCIARCGAPTRYECEPFTRSCDPSNMCACPEIAMLAGICDADARRVDVPCP